MTHRIVVDVQTGEVTQMEYTPEEQAEYDAAVAAPAAYPNDGNQYLWDQTTASWVQQG